MSWLPAVCFAGSRWWLPLSRPAADLIAAVLLQSPADQSLISAFTAHLKQDPPLAIFLALRSQGLHSENDPPPTAITSLVHDAINHIPLWFAAGEAFLSAPSNHDCLIRQWQELHETFIRLPHSKWLCAADQWLELTGPAVPAAIRQRFPSIADAELDPFIVRDSPADHYSATQLDLSLLARKLRRADTLNQSFGTAIQNAKQAALKQFAYGLSHEINNPLANISARAQFLMRDESDPVRNTAMQRIIDQSMRAHEMVADLMFYAHPPAPILTEVDLDSVLVSVVKQTRASIVGRNIELIVVSSACALSPGNPWERAGVRGSNVDVNSLQADRSMLTEAVRALVRNAVEAIGCDGRIELECVAGSENRKLIAVIFVRDSGPGLSDEARRHAFDPYFSGREAGRGLGVGLCRVQRIAELHHGGVSLSSGLAGCTARLWLPVKN